MFPCVYGSINSLVNSGRGSSSVCRFSRLIVITVTKHRRTTLFQYIFQHLIKEVTSQNKLYPYTVFWKYQTILMYNLSINRLYGNGTLKGRVLRAVDCPLCYTIMPDYPVLGHHGLLAIKTVTTLFP